MNFFENYVAGELKLINNDAAYDDEQVYARMVEAFKAKNRAEYSTAQEADLRTADALSPYRDVKTLADLNRMIAPETEEEGGALGFGVDNAQKLFGSAVSTIGDLVGVEGISDFGQAYVKKQEKEILENNYKSTYNKGGIETLTEDGAGAFMGWLGESILENFASTGLALVGGATAAALSGPLAAVVGAATTAGTFSLGIGEVRQELEDQGLYDPNDAALVAGVGSVVGLIDRIGGKGVPKAAIIKGMAESGALKQLGIASAKEFGTEATQEALVIGGAYMDGGKYETSEVLNRVIDAGIIGGAIGGGVKGTTQALSGVVPNAEKLLGNIDIGDVAVDDVGGSLGSQSQDGAAAPDEAGDAQTATPAEDAEGAAQAAPADGTTATQELAPDAQTEPEAAPVDPAAEVAPAEEVVEDVIQGDQETIPNTAGVVVNDDDVVDAPVRGSLENIAIQRATLNKDVPKTDIGLLKAHADSYNDELMAARAEKSNVLESWEEHFPEAENYTQMRKQAIAAVREEIVSLIEASGLAVEVSSAATSQTELQDNLARNKVLVSPVEKAQGGMLSTRVTGENYTYAEGLQAIIEAYGRGATGVRYTEIDGRHASEVTDSLFSPQARAAASSFIATGVDRPHILARLDITTEQQELLSQRDEFSPSGTEEERINAFGNEEAETTPSEQQSVGSRAREAGVIPEQKPIGDWIRSVLLDPIAEKTKLKTATRTSPAYKKFADAVQFSIFASQDADLSKVHRDVDAARATSQQIAKSTYRQFKQLAKKHMKKKGADEATLDQIYTDILTGRRSVILHDERLPADFDNIIKNDKDNAYLRSSDGVRVTEIDVQMLAPLSEFVTARTKEQKILLEEANARIQSDVDELAALDKTIQDTLDEVETIIKDDGGFEKAGFRAFDKSKNSTEWIDSLKNLEGNYLGSILDHAIEKIIRNDGRSQARAELDARSEALHADFFRAAKGSLNLTQFNAASNNAFLGKDGQLIPSIGLALGVIDPKMTFVAKEIARSIAISDRIDAQIVYNNKIANNGNYVADVYAAYLGNDITWVDGMDVPKTEAQKKRRADYEQSIADDLFEKAEANENPITEEEALLEAGKRVQAYVELVKAANGKLTGGGKEQHLLFSAINSSRKKNSDLTPEYKAFAGLITDPAILMEETINRMKEGAYAKQINDYIHNTLVGNGIFRGKAQVDAFNELHTEEAVTAHNAAEARKAQADADYAPEYRAAGSFDFDSMVKIEIRQKDNLSKFQTMYAHPSIAQSERQFETATRSDNKAFNFLQRYGADFRLLHTVASVPTGALNLIAGMTTMIMGGSNPLNVRSKGSVERDMAQELIDVIVFGKVPKGEDFVEALNAVAGSNVKQGEIQRDRKISRGIVDTLLSGIGVLPGEFSRSTSKRARGLWSGYLATGEALYKFGDLLPKMIVYGNVKADMIEQYSGILTEAEIIDLAIRHTRDMSFDMAQVPSIVRDVREKYLLGGAFLSYDSLLFATVTKNFRNIAELRHLDRVKWGHENLENFDPVTDIGRVDAARSAVDQLSDGYAGDRFANMTASMMAPVLAGAAVSIGAAGLGSLADMLSGDDDEQRQLRDSLGNLSSREEATENMRQLLPDYYRNATISPLRVTDDGAVQWIDVGRMTNHGKFMEGWNAMFNSDPHRTLSESAGDALTTMFGGYVTPGFGFEAFSEVVTNRTQFGQEIWNADSSSYDIATSVASHLLNDLGGTATISRLAKAGWSVLADSDANAYNRYSGTETSAGNVALEHLGVRIKTFDPVKELQSRLGSESYKLRADKTLFRSHLKTYNKVPDEKIRTQLNKLRAAHAGSMQVMLDKISAARGLNISEEEIKQSLKGKVTAKEAKSLLVGIVPQLDLGRMGERNTQSNSIKRIESEAKTNFTGNFDRAKEMNNSL